MKRTWFLSLPRWARGIAIALAYVIERSNIRTELNNPWRDRTWSAPKYDPLADL